MFGLLCILTNLIGFHIYPRTCLPGIWVESCGYWRHLWKLWEKARHGSARTESVEENKDESVLSPQILSERWKFDCRFAIWGSFQKSSLYEKIILEKLQPPESRECVLCSLIMHATPATSEPSSPHQYSTAAKQRPSSSFWFPSWYKLRKIEKGQYSWLKDCLIITKWSVKASFYLPLQRYFRSAVSYLKS